MGRSVDGFVGGHIAVAACFALVIAGDLLDFQGKCKTDDSGDKTGEQNDGPHPGLCDVSKGGNKDGGEQNNKGENADDQL